jgi:CobQ-like glutamine amidotransferase family enzyme
VRALRICVLYPDLLGTYGDGGNGVVLARRAQWRGFEATLLQAPSSEPVPEADLYCLGGGEDGPQVRAAHELGLDGTLAGAARDGAVVLAVCAGYQVLGHRFPGPRGEAVPGLGLLDVVTERRGAPRAVGEVVAQVTATGLGARLGVLSGFENHGGRTVLGEGVEPLAAVQRGVGNDGSGSEGAKVDRTVATYLHGPVLARNPALADLLLSWALDVDQLEALDDRDVDLLRAERLGR